MKNILKKNQIIITALAIMIAIAGYLTFTGNDRPDPGAEHVETINPDIDPFDVFTGLDQVGVDYVQNDVDDDDADVVVDENGEVVITDVEDADDVDAEDLDDMQVVPVETGEELGYIDKDVIETAVSVRETGELDIKDSGVPGEAVLANTTINASFFPLTRLSREQHRARSRQTLLDMIESTSITEKQKQELINRMIELTALAEKENATETMLEARGFDGAIVSINEETNVVDVIINATSISDQQVAIIEDIVKRKANVKAENIIITPVVVAD